LVADRDATGSVQAKRRVTKGGTRLNELSRSKTEK
jgi:hypothetical protein